MQAVRLKFLHTYQKAHESDRKQLTGRGPNYIHPGW